MATGTVKCVDGPSGYGVITPDAEGRELLAFEVREGGMGTQAVDVRLV